MASRGRRNNDEALLAALACGATIENAAGKAGIAERTAYRRLAEPEFQEKLKKIRSDMVERTCSMLTAASLESVKTLVSLQNESVSASVRLGAARAVLEIRLKSLPSHCGWDRSVYRAEPWQH